MAAFCTRCTNRGYEFTEAAENLAARPCPECSAHCPKCRGDRFLASVDRHGYEVLVPCACQQLHRRIERLNATRIPIRYAHCDIQTFKPHSEGNQREIRLRVYKHIEGFKPGDPGLLLWGNVGTGKTHLLVSILRELAIERGLQTRFVEFTHLISDIKEGFSQGRYEADVLAPLTRAKVLGIDELGKGLTTDWQRSILDEVISRRYNQGLTTYMTTNLAADESDGAAAERSVQADSGTLRRALETPTLRERLGERIYSRLHEMCQFHEVRGPDFRRLRGVG